MTCPPVFLCARAALFAFAVTIALPCLPAQTDPASRRAAIEEMYPVMIHELEAKNFGRARNICDQAIIWEPQNPMHHYNLACIEAQAGGARLPYAMGALELAVALGFDDPLHLQADPDLAPLHSDPKFAGLVRKVANNAGAGNALAAITIPERPTATPRPLVAAPAVDVEKPAPAAFKNGAPVGLYFMTRYWSFTQTLEKAAWYFAPDGRIYSNIDTGFSTADLGAHAGPQGTAKITGNILEVTWADGKKSASDVERDGTGFAWDMGIFTPVAAFEDAADLVGVYEGGESLSVGGSSVAVSKRLELRADGTFAWEGVAFVGAASSAGKLSAGSSGASTGRWQLSGYSLTLTDTQGHELRRIVFPYDDQKPPAKPAHVFFGGIMYKRQP